MRICFFALGAYPVLSRNAEASVGGAEIQQVLIASYLVKQGHDVSFVVRDHGQQDGEIIDGITVYKAYAMQSGIPYFRFIHPRGTGIWAALKRSNADFFYQRCAGMETGLLALFCKKHNKKFIFASGSDSDFKYSDIITSSARDKYIYAYGLKRANQIITQTQTQRRLLKENYHLEADVISNGWGDGDDISSLSGGDGYVLWVSTMRALKRPELFINMAEAMPDVEFVIVGGSASGENTVYDGIESRCKKLKNVTFKGFVPFKDVGSIFNGAKVVVNTSIFEGFPNTFLQAWQRSIPVLSYFDPDGIVDDNDIGKIVSSENEMLAALTSLIENREEYAAYQRRAKHYFDSNHNVKTIGSKYEKIFEGF